MSAYVQTMPTTQSFPACANWYALATLSRHERVAAFELANRGVETFLPTITEIHHWSDRRKKVEVPLFPGYVLINAVMSPETRYSAVCARGVTGFICMQGKPVEIPDREVESIHRVLQSHAQCAPYPFLKIGQRVRVRGGALDGVEGRLVRFEGSRKLVVSIDAISRSLALHIDGYDIDVI